MKSPFLLIFLLSLTSLSFTQSVEEKLISGLTNASDATPEDQLFLHIDRNLYHPGDTIRFQAYVKDCKTGIFQTQSFSLYSLLLDQGHQTIDSARFRIINSTASGWLNIPETINTGDYTILAFTSRMMNYDPKFVFSVPVRIDKLRQVKEEKEIRADKNITPAYQIPLTQTAIDLRFLPEGGTYIYGVPQRVAFNAVAANGSRLEVSGEVRNQRGEKIINFNSGIFGPGLVEFTPEEGDTYFAVLNGEEFSGMKWPLPVPAGSGAVMRVTKSGKGLIDIVITTRGVEGSNWLLSMTMNDIVAFSKGFAADSIIRFRVNTEEIPIGTAYITLFDNELNPVSERLIFLNEHKRMKVVVSSSPVIINRGGETELTINTKNADGMNVSSVVSVAVIDSLSGYYSSLPFPDIENELLYDRNFYDNLPSKVKLLGLNNIDPISVDLLLMTYGWRKFSLKDFNQNNSDIKPVNYDYLKVSNPGAEKRGRTDISILSVEGAEIQSIATDVSREAFLPFDSLDTFVRQVMILPDKNFVKNINPVRISVPDNKNFTDKAKLGYKDFSLTGIDFSFTKNKTPEIDLDSFIVIEAVTIRGKKPPAKVYVDRYQKMYEYAGTTTMYSKDFVSAFNFEDILVRYNPYRLDTRNKQIYLRPGRSFTQGSPPALFVVDNIPLYEMNYQQISYMPSSQIASVTILKGTMGFSIYGDAGLGGIVFVTTKAGRRMTEGLFPDDEYRVNDDLMKPFRLFRSEIEFYIPTKEQAEFIPEFQFRPTILWKNEVLIDGTGPVMIKYPNNMVKGTVMVIVNGVSFTNIPGSGGCKYSIK